MLNYFLEKLRGFTALSAEDIVLLESACEAPRALPTGYDLIREGEAPGPVFVILSGWACRYKLVPEGGRQILAFLLPGDFCDVHVGLLEEMDHSIATLTKARVATIPRARMDALLEASVGLSRAFLWTQLVDEGVLRAWIVSMGRRRSDERVAHLMCEIYVRMRNIGLASEDRCEMPLTQIVLADALGLTPIHVNRVLRKLRLAGVMELRAGSLVIEDPAQLARIAGFDDNYLHRRLRDAA